MEHYVVVANSDISVDADEEAKKLSSGPIVFETYLSMATLENAKRMAERIARRYGGARVAKLTFIDDGGDK